MPWATVAGNVELPLKLAHAETQAAREAVDNALAHVGFERICAVAIRANCPAA